MQGENGTLAARVAADTVRAHLVANFPKLRSEPEAVCVAAFELAHSAVLDAVLKSHADLRLVDGVVGRRCKSTDDEL